MSKFLVALDSSPFAPQVLSRAVALAQQTGAKLVLLRAVGLPTELPLEAYAMPPESVASLLEKVARKDLLDHAATVPAGLLEGQVVEIGVPWRTICDVAAREKVDLIVMGAHGHRFLDGVLGTTTGRVVTHAVPSVYVVRPATEAR
jgi:nucleotide-binding universal stress UspA family protein